MLATIIGTLLQFGSGFTSVGLLTLQALADAGDDVALEGARSVPFAGPDALPRSHCHAPPGTKHSPP
jgi:hypothetical protein